MPQKKTPFMERNLRPAIKRIMMIGFAGFVLYLFVRDYKLTRLFYREEVQLTVRKIKLVEHKYYHVNDTFNAPGFGLFKSVKIAVGDSISKKKYADSLFIYDGHTGKVKDTILYQSIYPPSILK